MPDEVARIEVKAQNAADGLELTGTEGQLRAVFAHFGEKDHDGDVTLPNAFEKGAAAPIVFAHDWKQPAIGAGVIDFDDEKAWFEGELNLKMKSAQEVYESIKFDFDRGFHKQQYSYAYRPDVASTKADEIKAYTAANPRAAGARRLLKKLGVNEFSPVLLGAGLRTGTAAIKSLSLTLRDNEELAHDAIESLVERFKALAALSVDEKGHPQFSNSRRERIQKLHDELAALLAETVPASAAAAAPKAHEDLAILRAVSAAHLARVSRQLATNKPMNY